MQPNEMIETGNQTIGKNLKIDLENVDLDKEGQLSGILPIPLFLLYSTYHSI